MSFVTENISTYFLCKGNWINIPHCVLRSNVPKINEKYGYCKVCWEQDFKRNIGSPNPEDMTKIKSFSDSKINSNFVQCGTDTL